MKLSHLLTTEISIDGRNMTHLYVKQPLNDIQCSGKVTQRRHKNVRLHKMITDRLRMVSWRDKSNLTVVVNLTFNSTTFPLPATVVQSKGQTFKKNYEYRDEATLLVHVSPTHGSDSI